jgi:hypothetical protein
MSLSEYCSGVSSYCLWWCQCWISFRIMSINPYLVTCDDAFHEVLIRFCLLKESGDNSQAVLHLLGGRNYAETRRMFKSSVKRLSTYCNVSQPLQKFHALLIATRTRVIVSFLLVDGFPDGGSSSTEFLPTVLPRTSVLSRCDYRSAQMKRPV